MKFPNVTLKFWLRSIDHRLQIIINCNYLFKICVLQNCGLKLKGSYTVATKIKNNSEMILGNSHL